MRSLTLPVLREHFPFREIRPTQDEALEKIASARGGVILEMPTGVGKTAVGLAALRALSAQGKGPLFYVTPTKTQVDQIERLHPGDVQKMMGRSEYPCLYYKGEVNAGESPCYMLECPHRVNQETGGTTEDGVEPCPYFQAKFEAKRRTEAGGIVVCTTAFFLTNRLMVPGWKELEPELIVVDEAHRLAKTTRGIFEFTMTDFHLKRVAEIVKDLDRKQAKVVLDFLRAFRRIARRRPSRSPSLIKDEEIERMLAILERFDAKAIEERVRKAVASGKIDPHAQGKELKLLENLVRNIPRFIHSFHYALEEEERKPLNYVVAFYYQEDDPECASPYQKARYYLTIKSYFVAPLIRKAMGENVLAYSATIGDPDIFRFETGLKLPFHGFGSSFLPEHTRVFLPEDTPNLAVKKRRRDDVKKSLKLIAHTALRFAKAGHRSLVVVVSEEERKKFLAKAEEIGLEVVTYGNGMKAKEAAAAFIRGQGQVLLGTSAHYSEGVDLPRGIAPVIFFLRPGYQRPDDPETQFEERRFSEGMCWALWNWRVMMEALQVRGRNIRDAEDVGVCFFISQQFRRFLYGALPVWLKPAYVRDKTMEAAVRETMKLLAS